MTPSAMADRMLIYCDTIAGFSVVNTLAFLIALAEPDVRCSLAGTSGWLYIGICIGAGLQTAALLGLRRKEVELRREADETLNPVVAQTMRFTQYGRIGLVWFYTVILLGVLYAGIDAASCG